MGATVTMKQVPLARPQIAQSTKKSKKA